MAVFEGSHGNILQGVSQQIPRSRLEGQVSEQINMVSDPVTGIRRRQGCKIKREAISEEATITSIKAWRTEVAGTKVEFLLDTVTGKLRIDEDGKEKVYLTSNYLVAPKSSFIRHAVVGESLYILNKKIIPKGDTSPDIVGEVVGQSGFANFITGALNREFTVSLRVTKLDNSQQEIVGTYTTPNGELPEHINQITPEYIAGKVYTDLTTKLTESSLSEKVQLTRSNSVIVAKSKDGSKIRMLANASDLYVVTSNLGNLKDVGRLPERMPDGTNGVMYSIGKDKALRYYKFDEVKGSWVETSNSGGYTSIKDMPVEVYFNVDEDKWVLNEGPFAGRLAGDEENNPDPDFVDWGITGISSYQGRLVLLSGSYVWLSASGLPRLFYRTTLEELLDTDPIGIGSSSATSASFQYAVNFNKDLVLFSAEHQALIAGMNTALTPKNANIMLTSTYTADMSVEPVSLGRSIMYPMPRSLKGYGMMEMIPSPYTDSAYISTDVTEHIPTYLMGRCRIAVSSTVGSIALFGSTECFNTLYVHEYVWEGDEKLLKAWHKWKFDKPVADVYFDGDLINLVFLSGKQITLTTIDPRSHSLDEPDVYLDFNRVITVEEGTITLQPYQASFLKDSKIEMVHVSGGLAGSAVGFTQQTDTEFRVTSSTEAKEVILGVPYRSEIQPSPPIVRDQEGIPISTNRLNLINYYCTTDNSGEYTVTVKDKARASLDLEYDRSPVQWLSTELSLGRTPIGGLSGDVIPCRVPAESSTVVFSTEGVKELNIVALEYVVKYNYRRQRR